MTLNKKVAQRSLTVTASVLALVGVAMIIYPFATDLWAARLQRGLSSELAGNADAYASGALKSGDALTRIEIPRLGVDTIVVEGTSPAALRAGAGHYRKTSLPGDSGNVAIAGHRTTYGKPFARMDELVPGDRVILTTPVGRHVYEILARPSVVEPTDWGPIDEYPRKGSFLTLTSCHPEGSARYRIVVHAELVESSDLVAVRSGA